MSELITPEVAKRLKGASPELKLRAAEMLEQIEKAKKTEAAQDTFMGFVKYMWPAFIEGRHHKIMAEAFEKIARGELKRLIINMPPRHTKSEFASYLLPAWFLGQYPGKKIIQTAHTAELSVGFGRKVRNLVDSEYFAIGVGGAVTGKGADLLIIDDPHSEQEGQSGDAAVFDRTYEWYTSGPRQRLQPGGAIVVVMTRWHMRDLTGKIIKSSAQRVGSDEWEVIEFPAIMPSGNPLWPEFWSQSELEALRSELPASKWSAQYQQNPTSEEGALIKREWWQEWDMDRPPPCEFIIQSWDTAFLKTQRSDYSACTTWGVFYTPDDEGVTKPNIILLDAYKERLEFPELKRKAYELWAEMQPDAFIVEAKAAGMPLIFELRAMGIPVAEYTPSRGNDKIARVNAVADLFASGVVWAPQTRFAEEVIQEFASFPSGEHDDLVDSSTQALLRFRQGGFLSLHTDEEDEPVDYARRGDYY